MIAVQDNVQGICVVVQRQRVCYHYCITKSLPLALSQTGDTLLSYKELTPNFHLQEINAALQALGSYSYPIAHYLTKSGLPKQVSLLYELESGSGTFKFSVIVNWQRSTYACSRGGSPKTRVIWMPLICNTWAGIT